ncbi:MAG: YfhO family protein [Marinifilaceae bacterium]
MNYKDLLKKIFPHFTAIIVFLLIGFIYFQPVLDGKQLRKGDTLNAQGYKKEIVDYRKTSGEDPLWTNSLFGGMPAYQILVGYKANAVLHKVKKTLELATPEPVKWIFLYLIGFYILMISLGINPWLSIIGSIAYTFSTYFLIIIGAGHIWKVHALAFMPPALAGILLCFRGKYKTGGLLTAFFLILNLYSNHIQMTYYFMLAVIIIGIFEFYYRFKQKDLAHFFKAVGTLTIASLIALSVNISNLYNSYQYSKETIRGKSELTLGDKGNQTSGLDKDYATAWSYGVQETLTLLIPNAKGGAGSPQEALSILNYIQNGQMDGVESYYNIPQVENHHYWGNQPFTAGPVYVGAIILFLFFLGLFIVRGALKWGLLTATILSIMLSWGHNFMPLTNFFLDYIPLYNKFRVVSSILIVAELCIPLLAILAVKQILDNPEVLKEKLELFGKKLNILALPLALTAGVALVLYLIPTSFLDFQSQQEMATLSNIRQANPQAASFLKEFTANLELARIDIFKADALRTVILILLAGSLLLLFDRKIIKQPVFIVALMALILVDLWPVNKRFLNNDSFVPRKELNVAFPPTAADFQILQMEVQNRPGLQDKIDNAMADFKRENRRASKLEQSIVPFSVLNQNSDYRVLNTTVNTFNNASTSYLHKSIGGYHGAKLRRYQELIEFHIAKNNMKVLNMLNTRYIIQPNKQHGTVAQLNPGALGNVWLANNFKLVENANQEILELNDFDPAQTAIVDQRFASQLEGFQPAKDTLASIRQTLYAPNRLQYEFHSNSEQIAVFSEIFYQPGWQAYIDGKKAPHFRTNYVLRGMRIPAGSHKIEFKFEPASFYICEKISVASMILFFLAAVAIIVQGLRSYLKNKKSTINE